MTGDLFTGQMDYIYLVYGFAFITMALAVFGLMRVKNQKMPWVWLLVFALLHGLHEWAEMTALSMGDKPWLAMLRLVVLATSFTFLLKFARVSAPARGRKCAPNWRTRVLFFCALTGIFAVPRDIGLTVSVRYLLGLAGALWASRAFYGYWKALSARSRLGLRLAAAGMAVYAVATGMIVPKASFVPASVINDESFRALLHFPVQMLRAAAAMLVAFGLWRHYLALNRPESVGAAVRARWIEGMVVAGFVAVLAVGWAGAQLSGRYADREERAHLAEIAMLAADMVGHEQSGAAAADGTSASAIGAQLSRAFGRSPAGDVAQAVQLGSAGIVLLGEYRPPGTGLAGTPGSVLTNLPSLLEKALRSATPGSVIPINDGNNSWIVAWSSGGGSPECGLIVHCSGAKLARTIAAHRFPPIVITILVLFMVVGFLVVRQRDIERRVAQRDGEARLKEAQTLAHVGNWEIDLATNHLVWSEELCRICGRSSAERATPEAFRKSIHPDDRKRVDTTMAGALQKAEPVELVHRLVLPDGTEKTVVHHCHAFFDDTGIPLRMMGTMQDITELTKAVQALRESQRMMTTLLSNLPGMAYRCRNDDKWTALFVSEGCVALTGYSQADHLDNTKISLADMIVEQHRAQVRKAIQDAIAKNEPFKVTYAIRDASGAEKWVWEQGRAVTGDDGSVLFLEGFITDITERVVAEEERHKIETHLQQTQKLESLGVLAGGIAHDFNNLLMAVLGNVDLALMELPETSPVRKNLAEIEAVSRRAADLCRQMLAYSGKGQIAVKALNLNESIREVSHMLGLSVSKKVSLQFVFADALPPVQADTTQMHQLLMNLVVNASEAVGDHQGTVTVSTGARTFAREDFTGVVLGDKLAPGQFVWCSVADTGCGMSRATQARIFDPFYSTKFTGRGLGLATALGIVRGHKGAIKVESEEGKGSIFTVFLPVAAGAAAKDAVAGGDAIPRGTGTVLVVDDDERIRGLAKGMLERLGYKALLAADGREAIDVYRARQKEVECIILDLTMPNMDGEETCREIRSINPAAKVIMSSGYDEQEVEQRFAGLGIVGFIQKPYRLPLLARILQQHIAGSA